MSIVKFILFTHNEKYRFLNHGNSDLYRLIKHIWHYVFFRSQNWVDEYPLHKCAFENDAEGINDLIQQGHKVTKLDRDSWAPIHYAAW